MPVVSCLYKQGYDCDQGSDHRDEPCNERVIIQELHCLVHKIVECFPLEVEYSQRNGDCDDAGNNPSDRSESSNPSSGCCNGFAYERWDKQRIESNSQSCCR